MTPDGHVHCIFEPKVFFAYGSKPACLKLSIS